jgi:hypothetical protein
MVPFDWIRICLRIFSGGIGIVVPIAICGGAALHAQQAGGLQPLLAMGQCTAAFKPTDQAPTNTNSGAIKLTFAKDGDGFTVKLEWVNGVGAYNNPHNPGLAFSKSSTLKKTSLKGASLGMASDSGKSVFNLTFEDGAHRRIYGTYTSSVDPGVPYTLSDCTP